MSLGPVPHNKALHQTRRVGAAASRPVVEARLAGEGRVVQSFVVGRFGGQISRE